MKVISSMDVSMQIVHKHGLFYSQVFDAETMNLIYETESLTKEGAATCIANFISEILAKGNQS